MTGSVVPVELEAKLLAPGRATLRALARLRQLGPYLLQPRDVVRLHSVYLDTAEFALAHAGVALRLRRQAGRWEATVKWAGEVDGAVHARPELNVPMERPPRYPFALPAGPLNIHLAALVAGRPLQPVLVSEVRRRRMDVMTSSAPGGPPLAELALDAVHLHPPGDAEREETYAEVEIERTSGQRRDVNGLARLLRRRFDLAHSPDSKLARGLALVGGGAPTGPAGAIAPVVGRDSVAQAARKVIARHLRRLQQNDPGTRLGEDPEALHDMRVAVRRLRAALRVFEPAFAVRACTRLRDELRWLGGQLGTVRDVDVQIGHLKAFGTSAPPAHRGGLEPFRRYLEAERVRRRRDLLAALDSERYFALLRMLEEVSRGQAMARRDQAAAQAPIALVGRRALKKAFRRLLRRGRQVRTAPTPEDLHALRIRAKRLRYLLEFLREVTGKPGRRLVKQLVRLQDLLGAYHDAVVAAEFVRLYVEGQGRTVEPSALLALGGLVGNNLRLAEHTRSEFQRVWERFARKRTLNDLDAVLRDLQAAVPPPAAPAGGATSIPRGPS
jgi:triphosphatase